MRRTVAAVPEEVVRLTVNGQPVATWTCSPVGMAALGAGRLVALGFIRSAGELGELRVGRTDSIHTLDARVAEESAARGMDDAAHRLDHGCGLRFLVDCRPERIARPTPAPPPPPAEEFPDLFRDLFDRSPARKDAGGHHTAALCDGDRLVFIHEEVGRHNGVDKVVGEALLAGLELPAHGLLTTARISGAIMASAAQARLAWVASRSVPTTLALEIAAVAGIATLARAASPDARFFGPEGTGIR
jgi:FdhD protein